MDARYCDGRAAITHPAQAALGAETLSFTAKGAQHEWRYAQLRRADDDNGLLVLKRTPDTGERLILDEDARAPLKAAAPALFTAKAHGVESPAVVAGLTGAAAALAALFLVGIPMAAEPIARALPPRYEEQIAAIARAQLEAVTEYCEAPAQGEMVLEDLAYSFIEQSPSPEDDSLRDQISVMIVQAPFPNAFAMPDGTIVMTDQLIEAAESPDELAGVLAHELAHVANDHVMANVIRNSGVGVFFDVVFGGAGAGQAVAIFSVNLASLRYNRADETEADRVGLDYLEAADIDPGTFARFFDRIAEMTGESEDNRWATLISSHPASAERAAAARARAHAGRPALDDYQWRLVRTACAPEGDANEAPQPPTPPPAIDKSALPPTVSGGKGAQGSIQRVEPAGTRPVGEN